METVMIRRKAHTPSSRLVEEPAKEREDATPGWRLGGCERRGRRAAGAALSIAGIALLLTACSSVPDQAPAPIGTPAAAGAETTPGTPTASPTPMAAQLHGSYVALGDSYSAGPDIPYPTGPTGGCGQSNGSYPYLVARR